MHPEREAELATLRRWVSALLDPITDEEIQSLLEMLKKVARDNAEAPMPRPKQSVRGPQESPKTPGQKSHKSSDSAENR